MFKAGQTPSLRASTLGMDEKLLATFKIFLEGPCNNRAVLVDEPNAEIMIADIDQPNSLELLAKQNERFPKRPIIVASLREPEVNGMIYVPKPIRATAMIAALDEARRLLSNNATLDLQSLDISTRSQKAGDIQAIPPKSMEVPAAASEIPIKAANSPAPSPSPIAESQVAVSEALELKTKSFASDNRRTTHQTAMLLDERAYSSYVGMIGDLNLKDPRQLAKAHYDKTKYLQSYVETAVQEARARKRICQLNCGWKPIIIFPHSNEIWIDADDKQVRSFCVVPVASTLDLDRVGVRSRPRPMIAPVTASQIGVDRNPGNFQSIDTFIWKVALWTSNGRVPDEIAFDQPVYLTRWPNLSRLVVIPHSLRIAALLVNQPMTLLDVAETLAIRHHYVFSFFSAAMALGLAAQIEKKDTVPDVVKAAPPEPKKHAGLFRSILKRLKVTTSNTD